MWEYYEEKKHHASQTSPAFSQNQGLCKLIYSLQIFDYIKVNKGFSIKLHNFADRCLENRLNESRVEERINSHGSFAFDGLTVCVPLTNKRLLR